MADGGAVGTDPGTDSGTDDDSTVIESSQDQRKDHLGFRPLPVLQQTDPSVADASSHLHDEPPNLHPPAASLPTMGGTTWPGADLDNLFTTNDVTEDNVVEYFTNGFGLELSSEEVSLLKGVLPFI